MKKDNFYKKAFLSIALVLSTASSLIPTAYANGTETVPSNASLTAQATLMAALTGQCRIANRSLGVFSGPAETAGTRVGVVQAGEIVRLAGEGNQGWIAVDFPQTGYVQAAGLAVTTCPTNLGQNPGGQNPGGQNPGTVGALCRQVAFPPDGLVIRANPNTTSAAVGGVARGQTVTLTTNPATTSKDAAGRTWVQISAPTRGWISNGLPGNATSGHLIYCSAGQTPPPPPPNRCRRVINPPEGLAIRSQPSRAASIVGGVGQNERITLTTSPATTSRDAEGRTWIQIEAPAAGWVSNGLGGQGNIGVCP